MSRSTQLLCSILVFLAGTLAALPAAHAQETVPTTLTDEQLATFAQIVGGSKDAVALRLLSQPDMLGLASEAVDARTRRLGRGRLMTRLGVAGIAVGIAIFVTGLVMWSDFGSSPCNGDNQSGCDFGGHIVVTGIGIVGIGGGAIVGLIGLRNLSDPSTAEQRAREAYAPNSVPRPKEASPTRPDRNDSFMGARGKSFRAPLLSFRF